jgi:hypothetical protein
MTYRLKAPAALLLGTTLVIVGCSKKNEEPEHRQIEGTVEKLDLRTGEVAMRFFHRKTKTEQVISGIVTDQTEVLINGRIAELKDIRLKERIKVTGYRKGSGSNAQIVALKVEIERPEWIETDGGTEKSAAKEGESDSN